VKKKDGVLLHKYGYLRGIIRENLAKPVSGETPVYPYAACAATAKARICRQILAEQIHFFKVNLL
jgi:hypothetical protein